MESLTYTHLLDTWEQQQSAYIADREGRFTALLDVLELTAGSDFHVLDLGCGPGSLSVRILKRFPSARVTAIDLDPMLLTVAREALAPFADRLRFIQADLTQPAWCEQLAGESLHAVVSSTALHWLLPEEQVVLYKNVASVLDKHGVFLNADHQRYDDRYPKRKHYAQQHDSQTQATTWQRGVANWDQWFAQALTLPEIAAQQTARDALFSGHPNPPATALDFQLAILNQAGFTEAGTVWQFLDDYVIAAWK